MTRTVPLKRTARIIAGQSPPSGLVSDLDGSELPFLQGNAEFGQLHPIPRLQCDLAPKNAERGDVLLSVRAPVGALNVADRRYGIGRGLCAIRPARELHQRFAWWMVVATASRLDAVATGSTYDAVSADDVATLRVPLPPPAIQRAVANYLDRETARLDALVSAKRRMVELLEERWQVVIHDAAAGRLARDPVPRRPASTPWLEDVPSHWREGLLKLVTKLGSGHTPSRSHPEWWADLTIPWITTGEVAQMRSDGIEYISETRERISELGMANSSATLHPAGTVVLCRTASAGYSAIMGRDMATSQDFATWTCGPLLRPRFLLLCLRAMRKDLLGRLAMGSTHKTIYMPDIESIKVPLPPLDEQDGLVAAAYSEHGRLDNSGSRIDAQIDLLRERRQALITAAVAGQLDISEAA